ncbi:MAG: FecR domain-containing protein [Hyphomicrobiales bacterium]|nr:FecR domain-containing protein [Hyphomicrobiales bacterium]
MAAAGGEARAQANIGATAEAHNQVSRDLAGAAGPLNVGDDVFRNEIVRTAADSTAKLVFLDSTNLAIGPTSLVTLDVFVYSGQTSVQKMTVNLAKGVFRFTTGALDKKAYEIVTPTAAIGVRGTVLDIDVRGATTRVTLIEGLAVVFARRPGINFAQAMRICAGGGRCSGVVLNHPGQTAEVRRTKSGALQAGLTSTPVDVGSLGEGSLGSATAYASLGAPGGSQLASFGGGFPAGALCGR